MLLISYLDVIVLLVVTAACFLRHLSVDGLEQHLSFVLIVPLAAEDGLVLSDGFMEGIMLFDVLYCTLHEVVVLFRVGWLLFD